MPSANTLPCLISLPASTMSCGVTWLSVPLMSSLPQRPQLESFADASLMAAALTVMFISIFSSHILSLSFRPREARAGIHLSFRAGGAMVPGLAALARDDSRALEIHLVAALEREDLARIIRRGDLEPQSFQDLAHLRDLLR